MIVRHTSFEYSCLRVLGTATDDGITFQRVEWTWPRLEEVVPDQ